jgi:hypothetical protein
MVIILGLMFYLDFYYSSWNGSPFKMVSNLTYFLFKLNLKTFFVIASLFMAFSGGRGNPFVDPCSPWIHQEFH